VPSRPFVGADKKPAKASVVTDILVANIAQVKRRMALK